MSYNERMPVIGIRIKKDVKELLVDLAKERELPLQVFCRKILENYLRQKDMFQIIFKKEPEDESTI